MPHNQEAKFSIEEHRSIESFEEENNPLKTVTTSKWRIFLLSFFPLLFLLTAFYFINKYLFFSYEIIETKYSPPPLARNIASDVPKAFEFFSRGFSQEDDYSSKSIVVYDLDSNAILYQKNAVKQTYIASLTKLASTKVSFDSLDLNQEVVISEGSVEFEGSALSLKKDQRFSRFDLLKAAVVASNNQSIYAIDNPENTVQKMNNLRDALDLPNTNFSNPAGYDEEENYSSASDLVSFAKLFFKNPILKEFASLSNTEVLDRSENKKIRVSTTNDLLKLGVKEVEAGKTGTTIKASQNLMLLVKKNGREYLIILLNGVDRYKDAMKVIERL